MLKNDSAERTSTSNRLPQIKQKPFFTMETIHLGKMYVGGAGDMCTGLKK